MIKLSPDEKSRIWLLSDGELYRDAITVVRNLPASVESAQMNGLRQYSRSWDELNEFVKHQRERDWGETGKSTKAHYQGFYQKMESILKEIEEKTQTDYGFIPEGKLNKSTKKRRDFIAGLLAREFIQHLVVEMFMKESKENEEQRQ